MVEVERATAVRASGKKTAVRGLVPVAVFAGLVLALSIWALWFGGAGWPLWLVVWLGVGAVIAGRTDWFTGIAAGPVLGVFVVTMLLRVTPFLSIGIAVPVLVVHLLIGLVTAAAMWREAVFAPMSRLVRPLRDLAIASSSALAALGAVLVIAFVPARWNVSWAMHGDSITSLMFSRYTFSDGGISPERPNPVPVPYSIVAAAMAPGRDALPAADLLRHDVGQFAQMWILIVLGAAVISGTVVVASRGKASWWFAAPLAVTAGALPLTWYVSGNALQFGFFNAVLAYYLLVVGWLLYIRSKDHPVWAYVFLTVTITVLLGTWGPLAIVLGCVLLVVVFRNWRRLVDRTSRLQFVVVIVATAQMVVYALAVTIPDFLREQAALAGDGGIFASTANAAIVVGAVLLVVAACSQQIAKSHPFAGILAFAGSGALLVIVFVYLRHNVESPWGYYPAKFAWLLQALSLVIILGVVVGLLGVSRRQVRVAKGVLAGGVIALVGALAFQIAPYGAGITALSPVFTVWRQVGIASSGDAAALALEFATPGEKNILVGYSDPGTDAFVNAWSLQINTKSPNDPIRISAYYLDVTDPKSVCEAIERFGEGTTIRTKDASLEQVLRSECPDQDFSVVLG